MKYLYQFILRDPLIFIYYCSDDNPKLFFYSKILFVLNSNYFSFQLALSGGGPKSTKRYVEQHGKMLPEDKLRHIIDEGTEFLELMQLAGLGMEYGNVPRASCLTGRRGGG